MSVSGERRPPIDDAPWHALDPEKVEQRLETGSSGLSQDEVDNRIERYGPNTLEEAQSSCAVRLFVDQFRSPLIYILVVAAIATVAFGELIDTAVIAFVLLLNAIIGFAQERKAEESVQALRQLVSPKANVIRDGNEIEVESAELVPGDLVLFESGTRVPADVRVIDATSLMVDESLLTGESVPVQKWPDAIDESTGVSDRTNILYAGTTVTSGRGHGYVVMTGDSTELGDIAEQVRSHEDVKTPLQARMDRFAKLVGVAVLATIAAAFALGIAAGISATDMFLVGVGLAVATMPEGLPIVFTVTMAIGVHRMARRNAIKRRLPAVETLGSATVIGSDKTGTLTEIRMTVREVWVSNESFEFGHDHETTDSHPENNENGEIGSNVNLDDQPALWTALLAGVLTNEAELGEPDAGSEYHGDPTEIALLVAAKEAGIDVAETRTDNDVLAETPFEPALRYSASLRDIDGSTRLFVKGAPERVLDMSSNMLLGDEIVPLERESIEETESEMAGRGLRVLAGAFVEFDRADVPEDGLPEPSDLTFASLYGLLDPPREGVKDAINGCQEAGIRVIMITGDHAATARALATDLGIAESDDEVLSGDDLDALSDEELDDAIHRASVFARVAPEHKLRIAETYRNSGEVVAITGDGVNDAPALKAADIGIAMGKSGTDIAREASDMVLTDDTFVSINGAVEQGRVTFDNVRKVTFFLISTAIAAPLTLLSTLAFGWPLPFNFSGSIW